MKNRNGRRMSRPLRIWRGCELHHRGQIVNSKKVRPHGAIGNKCPIVNPGDKMAMESVG